MKIDIEAHKAPKLSVIIPMCNVESYIDECLTSVASQDFTNFEAIIIDDGSTDGSPEIVSQWVDRDTRFTLYRQANAGPGAARNAGIKRSSGDYLAFLDADDKTPPNAYSRLIQTLESTRSDFATGNVRRFTNERAWQAPGYAAICGSTRLRTHVSRDRVLLRDLLLHNKVWRRTFWDQAQLKFPEGMLYEDVAVVIPAHVKARAVDVLDDVTSLWRLRDDGSSITQNRASDIQQLFDRIAAVRHVSSFLRALPDPSLMEDYQVNALERDIRYFVDILPNTDEKYRAQAQKEVAELHAQFLQGTLSRVSAKNRIKYNLLLLGLLPELGEYLTLLRGGHVPDAPLDHRDGQLVLNSELAQQLAVPEQVIDSSELRSLVTRVIEISLDTEELRITGWVNTNLYPLSEDDRRRREVRVWLEGGRRKLHARMSVGPLSTSTLGESGITSYYSGHHFVARFRLRALRYRRTWRDGRWRAMVEVSSGREKRAEALRYPLRGQPERPLFVSVGKRADLRTFWTRDWSLVTAVDRRRRSVPLMAVDRAGDSIRLTLELPRVEADSTIRLKLADGAECLTTPVVSAPSSDVPCALIPLESLSAIAPGRGERALSVEYRRTTGAPWQWVRVGDSPVPEGFHYDDREVWARRSRYGKLSLLNRISHPRVLQAIWDDPAALRVVIGYPAEESVEAIYLTAPERPGKCFGSFEPTAAGLDATFLLGSSDIGRLTASGWRMRVRTRDGDLPVELSNRLIPMLPISTKHRGRRYSFGDDRWHRAVVRVQ